MYVITLGTAYLFMQLCSIYQLYLIYNINYWIKTEYLWLNCCKNLIPTIGKHSLIILAN